MPAGDNYNYNSVTINPTTTGATSGYITILPNIDTNYGGYLAFDPITLNPFPIDIVKRLENLLEQYALKETTPQDLDKYAGPPPEVKPTKRYFGVISSEKDINAPAAFFQTKEDASYYGRTVLKHKYLIREYEGSLDLASPASDSKHK